MQIVKLRLNLLINIFLLSSLNYHKDVSFALINKISQVLVADFTYL